MNEIKLTVDFGELIAAINSLTAAVLNGKAAAAPAPKAEPAKVVEMPAPKAEPVIVQPAEKPRWTMEQLARAGSDLVAAGKTAQVVAILNEFGIKTLVRATEDQYNAIGERLIAIGGKL